MRKFAIVICCSFFCLPLFSQSGLLYGVRVGPDEIGTLNQTSGDWNRLSDLAIGAVTGLAYDPNSNTLYGSERSSRELFVIDTQAGIGTAVQSFSGGAIIEGLAYDPQRDVLYGLANDLKRIITIDVQTGVVTPLPFPLAGYGFWRGLAYDSEEDVLWASSVNTPAVYKVDPQTGRDTLVAHITPNFVHGLAHVSVPQLSLNVYPLVSGAAGTLSCGGAQVGDSIQFVASLTGAGPTQTPYGLVRLSPPFYDLGAVAANSQGVAILQSFVSPALQGRTIWIQAGGFISGVRELSNGVMEVVR